MDCYFGSAGNDGARLLRPECDATDSGGRSVGLRSARHTANSSDQCGENASSKERRHEQPEPTQPDGQLDRNQPSDVDHDDDNDDNDGPAVRDGAECSRRWNGRQSSGSRLGSRCFIKSRETATVSGDD